MEAQGILAGSSTKAEVDVSQLSGKVTRFANVLHSESFNVIFDKARKHIDGLGVEVHLHRLSDERRRSLDAETLRRAEMSAANAKAPRRGRSRIPRQ